MPIFANLFIAVLAKFYAFSVFILGAKWGLRLTAAMTIAGLYVACALTFTVMIGPWLAGMVSTAYGALLGLLFPPVAGTVIASLGTWWACILAKKHTVRLLKMTVGG